MKGILYLWLRTIKNRILQLKEHPAQLAAYALIAALLVFVLATSILGSRGPVSDFHDIAELRALITGMLLFVFYSSVTSGLSSGSSFFGLHDVNLLFTSPISPRKILIYGLVRQMSASLLASVFILFQANILKERYNIDFEMLLLLLFAYASFLVAAQIIAMVIYTFTNGREFRQRVVRGAMYLSFAPLAADFVLRATAGLAPVSAAVSALNAEWIQWYPFIGWLPGAVFSLMSGDAAHALVFFLLPLAAIAALIVIIMKTNIDYYEDVLQATERTFQIMEAAREGRIADAKSADKIRMRDRKGIGRGKGGSVIFFKHMLENRRGGYLFFDNISFIQLTAMIVFALVIKAERDLLQVFIFSVVFQFFTQSMSRWIKELVLPYIFLIPVRPFGKLVYACMESIVKTVTDGILIFICVGWITGAAPYDIAACVIARAGFGILFTAGNILSEKLLGSMSSKGFLVLLYLLTMLLLALPGIVLAAIVPAFFDSRLAFSLALTATFLWNTAIAAVITGLCRNILHQTDISANVQ